MNNTILGKQMCLYIFMFYEHILASYNFNYQYMWQQNKKRKTKERTFLIGFLLITTLLATVSCEKIKQNLAVASRTSRVTTIQSHDDIHDAIRAANDHH